VVSHYYDICYNEILLIAIPNLYTNHSQTIEIQTGYSDSLVILIHFPYPIIIVITRVYCRSLVVCNFSRIQYSRYYDTAVIREMYQYIQTINITSINLYWIASLASDKEEDQV
jgi:hypothetical protein